MDNNSNDNKMRYAQNKHNNRSHHTCIYVFLLCVCMYVCVCVCVHVYVCMCVCMSVCVCVHRVYIFAYLMQFHHLTTFPRSSTRQEYVHTTIPSTSSAETLGGPTRTKESGTATLSSDTASSLQCGTVKCPEEDVGHADSHQGLGVAPDDVKDLIMLL